MKKARELVPDVNSSMLIKGGAGVRAQAITNEGNLFMDFKIIKSEKYL